MSMTTGKTKATGRQAHQEPNSSDHQWPLTLADGHVRGLEQGTLLSQLDSADWLRWSRHLAKRKRPTLAHLAHAHGLEPLSWAPAADETSSDSPELLAQLQRWLLAGKPGDSGLPDVAEAWLKEAPSRVASAALGIEALAWCHALPALAAELSARVWCQLVEQLLAVCQAAAGVRIDQQPLAQQLLAGELPLTLAWTLPEIDACQSLAKGARAALSDGILELLDEGLPRGQHLTIARPLLACWTRAALVGESPKKGSFRSGAQDQYRNFVRHMVCFSRPDGGQMLTSLSVGARTDLIDAALAIAGDEHATASAEALFFGQSPPLNGKRRLLLPAAIHSDWSELAVLRANWSKNSPALAINYSAGELACELVSQQRLIWSGRCDPQIRIDGTPTAKVERWEEVCWFCDDDVQYIELEAELGAGWKTQRQFLLARTDAILLIADAIVGPVGAAIDYKCVWPTSSSLTFTPAAETCEGTLQSGTRRFANVIPLALPEWRSDGRRNGSLQAVDGGLAYRISRAAQRLYVPLVVDLEPWRIKRELTWRQLAVGHNLVPQSPEIAVGYRLQLHKQQWLIYRSLAERASRTVLGQNIFNEFVCARFNRGGDADPLIEIE